MSKRPTTSKGVPRSVRKAELRAEAIHKNIYGDPESDTTDQTEPAEALGETQTDGGVDTQPVEAQESPDAVVDTAGAAPSPDKPEAEPAPEPAPAPAATPAEDWQAKYNSLQGKYNAEVPRMAADLRSMRDEMAAIRATTVAPAPNPEPAEKKTVVSDQDTADYGEDLIDLIRRVSRGEASELTGQLTPQIETIRGQVAQSKVQQVTSGIYAKLDAAVGDWRDINRSADFLSWLEQSDPYAGDIRKNLIGDAFQKGDGERVAAFFKGYLAEQKAVAPVQAPATTAQAKPAPQVSLDRLAGPTGGVSASETVGSIQPQTPQWNGTMVRDFYADVSKGVYKNDPKRMAQIEKSIATAVAQGTLK